MEQLKKVVIFASLLVVPIFLASCNLFGSTELDPPTILGADNLEVEVLTDSPNWLEGVTAQDHKGDDLTMKITVDDSQVDLDVLGVYSLTYIVEDTNGKTTTKTINIEVVDETPPVLEGYQNLIVELGQDVNWLEGISAIDNYDGDLTGDIIYDDSDINIDVPGTYTLNLTVEDSSNNVTSISVNVEVVEFLAETFENLDIMLLEELTGEALEPEVLGLIEDVSELRVQNLGFIYIPDMTITHENIQESFVFELDSSQMDDVVDYLNLWEGSIAAPDSSLTHVDVQRIITSFVIGRNLTLIEENSFGIIEVLKDLYNSDFNPTEDPDFDQAEVFEIEGVIGRSLTVDEIEAIEAFRSMKNETYGKYIVVLISNQIGRVLVFEESQAFKLLFPLMMDIPGGNEMPTVEDIESYHGIVLDSEQLAAHNVIESVFNELMLKMMIDEIEQDWDRELTEIEIGYMETLLPVVMLYENNYDYEDPEFEDTTILQLESVIDRQLTGAEIEARNYVMDEYTKIMLVDVLERELTPEEIAAIPIMRVIEEEYENNQTETDPIIEEATNSEIEAVIGRVLTVDEKDALEIYRYILDEISSGQEVV